MDKIPATGNLRVLTLILSESKSHKCIHLAKEKGIRGGMVMIGKGTVNSAILNLLGIKSEKKEIISFLLEKEQAEEMLDYLDKKLQLEKAGHGIAYITLAIDAAGLPDREADQKQVAGNTVQSAEGEIMFKKLTVIVDRGMADDVMDIAREAGVRGGTILHGRGAGAEIATKLFGVEIEPERELVIILTPDDLVEKVAHAVSHGLNLKKPGRGVLFVEPVLETRGLFEMSDENKPRD